MPKRVIALLFAVFAVFIRTYPAVADDELSGMVVGRTGEVLHISLPQPVAEGTVISIRPISSEEENTARVLSCTEERPYIALAKIVEPGAQIAVGVKAYAEKPKAAKAEKSGWNNDRFSIQAGAFYPAKASLRDDVGEYWQAYRLNYSLLRMDHFETLLSAEYAAGNSDSESAIDKSMEIVPMTLIGRIKPIRMGGMHLFLGAGGGMYHIRQETGSGASFTSSTDDKFGHELTAGLESNQGWVMELRYRNVPDTEIEGYSLTIGGRF